MTTDLERVANVIMTVGAFKMDTPGVNGQPIPRELVVKILKDHVSGKERQEGVQEVIDLIQAVVSAYLGHNPGLDAAARLVLEQVSATNRAKRFVLPTYHGPRMEQWEMIVRKVRDPEAPGLILPGNPSFG